MRKEALSVVEELIESNEKIVFIGSDLGAGTLDEALKKYPKRVLMEGIAEQHLVGFASGLALEGFIPIVHTISTFIYRRALEQVIIDCALHKLPVIFLASGGGMVYAPLGPTHQAIDDFAHLTCIPNLNVIAPLDPLEMRQAITLSVSSEIPSYIRIGKGGEPTVSQSWEKLETGKLRRIFYSDQNEVLVISTGAISLEVEQVFSNNPTLKAKINWIHLPYLKPFDRIGLEELLKYCREIIIVEEHIPQGGLFTQVCEIVATRKLIGIEISHLCLPFDFAKNYGSEKEHREANGMDNLSISLLLSKYI
jgi:transketolase